MAATGTRRTVAPQASSIIPPSLRSTVYRIVPPASLPSKPMLLTLIPWGATLGLGAIWMVQVGFLALWVFLSGFAFSCAAAGKERVNGG